MHPSTLTLYRVVDLIEAPQSRRIIRQPSERQKRKRGQEDEQPPPQDHDRPPSKRRRTSSPSYIPDKGPEKAVKKNINDKTSDSIKTWIASKRWPKEYFEQDSQVRQNLEHDSWLEEQMEQSSIPVVQYVEINGVKYPSPIRKVPTSVRRKQSDSSLTGSGDQKKRENKSAAYRDTRYSTLLAAKGSYMHEFDDDDDDDDISKHSRNLRRVLLEHDQTVPESSLFRDDLFKRVCREIEDRNEAMIIQDITRLIVPSAKNLGIYGARHLDHLIENVNEAWTGSIPVEGPRPQPDYCVGFRRSAFTDEQLKRLSPLIGSVYDTSFFVATYRMHFPFLACEVKCGAAALDIADRQNAHSMTIAVRGIVELYKAVKREKELHGEILAFSISHDHRAVRIYGHYPIIHGDKTAFYRYPIRTFDFTELDGRDKWTAYKFTKNVYDVWMPTHLRRICSIIDQLPSDLNFEVPELHSAEASGLSQGLSGLLSEQSNVESASQTSRDESGMAPISLLMDTPDTSVSQVKEKAAVKRSKRKHVAK